MCKGKMNKKTAVGWREESRLQARIRDSLTEVRATVVNDSNLGYFVVILNTKFSFSRSLASLKSPTLYQNQAVAGPAIGRFLLERP